jgi:excinuclease UvrABC nuclease subunit
VLTPLRNTDILKIKPDVDALDLFSENFKLSDIPAHFGCYAFYRKRDRVVIYIGSACADGISADSTGLRMRLGTYRPIRRNKSRSGTILKVREAHAIDPLLVCCWLCESEGDCRKYEVDAIRTHHPVLNQLSTKSRSAEEKRKIKRARARTYAEKPKNYNPTSRVVCRGCGITHWE